jgi:hypothetical protein
MVDMTHPTPGKFDRVWHMFYYEAESEASITATLMSVGRVMVPAICSAIRDRKMAKRRYAISALGYIEDRRAILALETIYADSTEDPIFRGDALASIFRIDQSLGRKYARQVLRRNYPEDSYLREVASEVFARPENLLEFWAG